MRSALGEIAIGLLCVVGSGVVTVEAVATESGMQGDFRNSIWGDSIDEARRSETADFHHQSDDELAFTDTSLEGIDGGILYLFERGRLVTGLYVARHEYLGGEGVLEDYRTLRRHLERRLEAPGEESLRWIADDPAGRVESPSGDRLAALIADGSLRVSTEWSLERTHVELIMTGTEEGGVFLRAVFKPSS